MDHVFYTSKIKTFKKYIGIDGSICNNNYKSTSGKGNEFETRLEGCTSRREIVYIEGVGQMKKWEKETVIIG